MSEHYHTTYQRYMKTTEIMGLTIAIVFIVFISYLGSCIYDGVTK